MRKLHQMEKPDPPVSEGECIEYTTIDGKVFNVLAVTPDRPGACLGCTFSRFRYGRSAVPGARYVCDCGPHGERSLCDKGLNNKIGGRYCKFVDMDTIMENL